MNQPRTYKPTLLLLVLMGLVASAGCFGNTPIGIGPEQAQAQQPAGPPTPAPSVNEAHRRLHQSLTKSCDKINRTWIDRVGFVGRCVMAVITTQGWYERIRTGPRAGTWRAWSKGIIRWFPSFGALEGRWPCFVDPPTNFFDGFQITAPRRGYVTRDGDAIKLKVMPWGTPKRTDPCSWDILA